MLENFLRDRTTIERLRGGLFGPHLDSFVANLAQLGYARETVQKQLRLRTLSIDGSGSEAWPLRSDRCRRRTLPGRATSRGHLAHGDPRTIHHSWTTCAEAPSSIWSW